MTAPHRSTPVSPSWYDLLDLDPKASDKEIRVAWKAAIADLDPTDRRFRVYNQAAEVLLDEKRRAAYDAELATVEPEPDQVVAPPSPRTSAETAPDADPDTGPATPITDGPATAAVGAGSRRTIPAWVLAAVAVLTVGVLVAVGVIWVKVPSDASVEQSTGEAQAAAERAVGPILSYDYRHLDEDQQAAESYLTSDYRQQYDKLFAVIKQNAPGTQTAVKAQVIASGIVRSGNDRVDVLLFVDRPTTNKQQKQPVVYKDQVTVTMQKVGSDWLVDNLATSPVAD